MLQKYSLVKMEDCTDYQQVSRSAFYLKKIQKECHLQLTTIYIFIPISFFSWKLLKWKQNIYHLEANESKHTHTHTHIESIKDGA